MLAIVRPMLFARRGSTAIYTLLCVALLALALVGCGGKSDASNSGGSVGSSTAPDSAPQFIARADAICGRINREIVALKPKSASAKEVIRVVPHTVTLERNGISELERLAPPSSLADDWRRMLEYRRTLAGELAQLVVIARKNNGTSIKPLGAAKKRAHGELAKVAKEAGFKDCATVGRAS